MSNESQSRIPLRNLSEDELERELREAAAEATCREETEWERRARDNQSYHEALNLYINF